MSLDGDRGKGVKCILGYVVALCNQGGGSLVIGMSDRYPHEVVGTEQSRDALGQLESDIYNRLQIHTDVYELLEGSNRVVVITVPSRPRGKYYYFNDTPLMRVGEELKLMSLDMQRSIILEIEPDFSDDICHEASINDLSPDAIRTLKEKYALKHSNSSFESLSSRQALSDLGLLKEGKVTKAAIILLGKADSLSRLFPQVSIELEYRAHESHIHYDKKYSYADAYYLSVDEIWKQINHYNGAIPIREGMYQHESIPFFNEEVIREAINNAVAHRNYALSSSIVIKLSPTTMSIISPGGFPHGVSLDNLLDVPSTPRNRLLADVLSKTGLVERAGQGIDRIFMNTLQEGKRVPDYTSSDDFYIKLTLGAEIEDMAFTKFIKSVQDGFDDNNKKLTVHEVHTLYRIKQGEDRKNFDKKIIDKLLNRKLILKKGKTQALHYILCEDYYDFTDNKVEFFKKSDWDDQQAFSVLKHYLDKYEKVKMGAVVSLFEGHLSRKQVRNFIKNLVDKQILDYEGEGKGRCYFLSDEFIKNVDSFTDLLAASAYLLQTLAKDQKKASNEYYLDE